jgi:hypothetical protein
MLRICLFGLTKHRKQPGRYANIIHLKEKNLKKPNLRPNVGLIKKNINQTRKNHIRDGSLKTIGTDIDKIMPAISRFSGEGGCAEKKRNIIGKLLAFFERPIFF